MNTEVNLTTPVQFLKSVGPARARALQRLDIETVNDLLHHYPRRYFDRTQTAPVGRVRPGQDVTVSGEVLTSGERRTQRGGSLQTVSVGDDTGVIFCVWFNQKYVLKSFRSGRRVMVSGVVQRHGGRMQLTHPDFEFLDEDKSGDEKEAFPLHTGRLVPVYGLTAGIGQHWLRALVHQALTLVGGDLPEALPADLRRRHRLPDKSAAVRGIHFPASDAELQTARRRLVFEEIYLIQILMALRRGVRVHQPGIRLQQPGDLTTRLVSDLPFTLTGAQRRVLKDVLHDLRSGQVMHRLVQGDVGSGKTLVALIAALFAIEQGHQALMMAPTEVLARQHGLTCAKLLEPLQLTVETLTGSTPAAERRAILAGVAAGEIDFLVGTHAVIQQDVHIPRLAVAVVDEQHRFGVRQRGQSAAGAAEGAGPTAAHMLVMSATPIPRSLSLTLYGDLDLSIIDELPAGRLPVATRIMQDKQEAEVWSGCHEELTAGHQVYVIYPVIEETEGQDLKAATAEFERLRADVFPEHDVALLHGRMKAKEKASVMQAFTDGEVQVLVATSVVEVGIDVPNATAMVIHSPERFGLAQLHQLRGRIGRGRDRSRCWLLCDRFLAEESFQRIRFFANHNDGFALAEEDLRLRGPGDVWGTRQHGAPGFRLANPLRDHELVEVCRGEARALLQQDPDLKDPGHRSLVGALTDSFGSWLPPLAG